LSDWIAQVERSHRLGDLVSLEVWLRSLKAFLTPRFLPLAEAERGGIADRDFTREAHIIRRIIQLAEFHLAQLSTVGQSRAGHGEVSDKAAPPAAHDAGLSLEVLNLLSGPTESLQRLLEVLNDLRVFIDSVTAGRPFRYAHYAAVGRLYGHSLKDCRHIQLLLSRQFKSQYDRVESPAVGAVLHKIEEETRQRVALVLLHLFQILKHLQVIGRGLGEEGTVRHCVAVFSLVHEDAEQLRSFIRSRFSGRRALWPEPQHALEWLCDYLGAVLRDATCHELAVALREASPAAVALNLSKAHDTLRYAVQGCIASLTSSFEPAVRWEDLFGGVPESAAAAVRVHRDLWEIRRMVRGFLTGGGIIEVDRLLGRLTHFRESHIQRLAGTDWQELERFSGKLLQSRNQTDLRRLLGEFMSFLGTLADAGIRAADRSSLSPKPSVA